MTTPRTSTAVDTASALRDMLLARGWPTSVDVGRANGAGVGDLGQWAKDKRDAGELLGVWSATEHTYRHPSFQFDAHGRLNLRVKQLLAALATVDEFKPVNDKGGWRRAFWLHGKAPGLPGADRWPAVPADLFQVDPARVIAFACKASDSDLNGLW